MNAKILVAFALFALLAAPAVLADDMQDIKDAVGRVTTLVSTIGGAIAILAMTVVGVMMFQAKDPSEKDQLKERLKYIIIGLVLIVVAPQIVRVIMTSNA